MTPEPRINKGIYVELRGLEPLTPTLPARVISQISYWPVSPEVANALCSLGFVVSRASRCLAVPRDDH